MELLDFKNLVEAFSEPSKVSATCALPPNDDVVVNIQIFDEKGYIRAFQRREFQPEQIHLLTVTDAMWFVRSIVDKIENQK